MIRHSMLAIAGLTAALMNAEAEGSTAGGAPAETTTAEGEARKRAAAANFLPIVRGRLPLLFVHAVRFDKVLAAMSTKDLASKLATSVGKVFDIRKGRNFAYITADYRPSAEDITAAEAWIAQVGSENAKGQKATGDTTLMQNLLNAYKAAGLATPEQTAALSAARAPVRAPKAPAGALPTASAGASTEGVQATSTSSADALLS